MSLTFALNPSVSARMRISACSPCSSHLPFVSSHAVFRSSSRKLLGFSSGGTVGLKLSDSSSFQELKFRRNSYSSSAEVSPWDEKPYDLSRTGKRVYLDELDVATFLDPPKELIPLDPASYNPAGYLWKKIGDIPEDRRHRLLYLLRPRHVARMWAVTGTRYDDPKLLKKSASELLCEGEDTAGPLEFWNCKTDGVPLSLAWMNRFNKVIFHAKDGNKYGRMFPSGNILQRVANSWYPCYFRVTDVRDVMSTSQPCDLAYEYGDGLLEPDIVLEGFPNPAKHPWPLSDLIVIYVRHAGPGVMVGQAWQEGRILEQVPKKFCGEILMVKDYYTVAETL
ncbi:uncharacterized protein LOC116252379 isoform X2 [Nymphaea colorata]|uniref:uncharacterized protein LOC116252379 isoform X2 n=1 Tax=Nymphaea colorata TaxID=210225 RepID=UPI00129E8D38|nr:uncharacterized protein LOC116252379 isoform X2 [Nymphaea colorata]